MSNNKLGAQTAAAVAAAFGALARGVNNSYDKRNQHAEKPAKNRTTKRDPHQQKAAYEAAADRRARRQARNLKNAGMSQENTL